MRINYYIQKKKNHGKKNEKNPIEILLHQSIFESMQSKINLDPPGIFDN